MKTIIFFALVLALVCSMPFTMTKANEPVKFDLDLYEESPIGFTMRGQIDPRNEQLNKIETFLRLADQYIPVLESIASNENSLTWRRNWQVTVLGFNLEIYLDFQLKVGWKAKPGSEQVDKFDVVYTPFAWGRTSVGVNGTSWPVEGSSKSVLQFLHAYAPIAFSLYQSGKVCFKGGYAVAPVTFFHHIFASLRECQDEILDDLINGTPIFVWTCDMIAPVNASVIDLVLYDGMSGDLVPETCIEF